MPLAITTTCSQSVATQRKVWAAGGAQARALALGLSAHVTVRIPYQVSSRSTMMLRPRQSLGERLANDNPCIGVQSHRLETLHNQPLFHPPAPTCPVSVLAR